MVKHIHLHYDNQPQSFLNFNDIQPQRRILQPENFREPVIRIDDATGGGRIPEYGYRRHRRGPDLAKQRKQPIVFSEFRRNPEVKNEPDLTTARQSPPNRRSMTEFGSQDQVVVTDRIFETTPSKIAIDQDKIRKTIQKHSQSPSTSREESSTYREDTTPQSSWSTSEHMLSTSPSSLFSNSPSTLSVLTEPRRKSSAARLTSLETVDEDHQLGATMHTTQANIPPTQTKPEVGTSYVKLGKYSIPEKNLRPLTVDLYNELLEHGYNNQAQAICVKYHKRNNLTM